MIINYFRIAVRNLVKQKSYSLINIVGLSLGLATSLFIFLWVYDEVSYDRFNEDIETIYRVEQDQVYNGKIFHVTVTPYPSGEGWKKAIPEIVETVRFGNCGTLLCKYGEKRFYESSIVPVDSSVFDVFTFPLYKGDPSRALTQPNSIVLSHEMAIKYFGDNEPMGQTIVLDNQHNMQVTGVLEKMSQNSSIRFDFLVPFDFTRTLGRYNDSWSSNSIFTFAQLNPNSVPGPVDQKLIETVKANLDLSSRSGGPDSYQTKFMLAPLKRVHLHQYFGFIHTAGNYRSVIIMSLIGIFILIIASINYMNLSTARSARRAREIGLRKVSGGRRGQLISQFFAESITTSTLAMLIAILLVALLLDPFRTISSKAIHFDALLKGPFIIGLIGMTIFTGIFAGIYPAIFLSGFKPVKVLYGDPSERGGKGVLRKILVILQFTISLLLITGTSVVYLQNNYLRDFDRGYEPENILYIQLFGDMNKSYYEIRDAIKTLPEVEYVSASNHVPGRIGSNGGGMTWDGKPEDLNPLVSQDAVDFDYCKLMGIPVVDGRSFSQDYSSDLYSDSTGGFMINETLKKIIDEEDIIGMNLSFMGITGPIVGVMGDYNFTSLRNEIPPLATVVTDPRFLRFISLRLNDGDIKPAIGKIEAKWDEIMPDYPFEYRLLVDDFENQNRAGTRMGTLLLIFTVIAIAIACLGLLGLSAFMATKRTREIGIRKTMGSSAGQIIGLMVRQFSWLIIISIAIGIPLSYYLMDSFLQDYANQIQLRWYVFAVPAFGLFVMAILAVLYQSVKASKTHPSVCLRYE